MDARTQRPKRLILPVLLMALLPGRGGAVELVPLAVQAGRCETVLPTDHISDQYYLILSVLAREGGPYRVTVQAEPTLRAVSLPRPLGRRDEVWGARVKELAERLDRARCKPRPALTVPSGDPPRQRVFHLFAGQHDFHDPRSYVTVQAELAAVGKHCQVYGDRDEPDRERIKNTAEDAVRAFDEAIYPRATEKLGRVVDVDGDGRFTILFTGWLGRLQRGKVSLGGFVRGSDFYRDVAPPLGNRCDVMYVNANLRPGPHLRAVLAHEYTHAIVFSEHVLTEYVPGLARQDEE
ncbi:MAG: hypothetical protein L0Z62_38305, partial [Gemmataceae bacterium]|nr:hypothetical protein [Gemmataceae bacterium]